MTTNSLAPMPAGLVAERIALHRLATYVIGPARYQHVKRFGLRSTAGGFGTPEFGDPARRVRVASGDGAVQLIVEQDGAVRTTPVTSLNGAAAFIGSDVDLELATESDSPPAGDLDADLEVSTDTIDFLGAWWALGTEALEAVRGDQESVDPSIVQLWPGHFDPAIEVGDENRRASVGASPGDDGSNEPYLYVSVWWSDRLQIAEDPYWNAEGFVGARMTYSELLQADDPLAAATAFYRRGRDLLVAAPDA